MSAIHRGTVLFDSFRLTLFVPADSITVKRSCAASSSELFCMTLEKMLTGRLDDSVVALTRTLLLDVIIIKFCILRVCFSFPNSLFQSDASIWLRTVS
jgi:hypothetical protein